MSVIVIGGGFAGLSAAAALAERGVPVTVLDARPRLGGRATAFRDRHTGEPIDNGQHVLFGCYRETFRFLDRIGAMQHVEFRAPLEIDFVERGGKRSTLRCPSWLMGPLHLLVGVLRWHGVPLRARLSARHIGAALRRPIPGNAAAVTVAEWLRQQRQDPVLIERLWEPLAVAALNQSIEEAAAAPFVRVLADMFGANPLDSSLVLPLKPLDELYAVPARAFIESRGGTVRTDALARLVIEGDRAAGVIVRGERLAADAVISAVPWHQLPALFSDVPASMSAIVGNASALASMPIVTVNLWYDRVVMDRPFIGLHGGSMHWVFDKRRVFGESASHLSVVASAAGALTSADADSLVALAAREIGDRLPAARNATLVRGTVIREKQATFSLSPAAPPRPATRTPLANFHLAGDWIDTGLPGTIESAVVSGHWAARAIVNGE